MKQSSLTDEEIEAYQDFDSFIKQARPRLGKWVYYAVGSAIILTSLVSMWWKNNQEITPGTVKTSQEILLNTPEVNTPEQIVLIDSVHAVVPEKQPLPKTEKKNPEAKTTVEEKSKAVGYKQAEPVGGYEELYSYFNQELLYPEGAIRDSIQGVVVIDFVINIYGKPEQIQVQQSLSEACDVEAVRVIETMQPWIPASFNGKPIPARISVPLTFQLIKPKQE